VPSRNMIGWFHALALVGLFPRPASGASAPQRPNGCDPGAGNCDARPFAAAKVDLTGFRGLSLDRDGGVYLTGILFPPTHQLDGFELTSTGQGDVVVARYAFPRPGTADRQARATWAKRLGDPGNQQPTGLAVTADGTVTVVGNFTGSIEANGVKLSNPSAVPKDFVIGLRASDGALRWGHAFDEGVNGGLVAVAAHPDRNVIAVCGQSGGPSSAVPNAKYGGGAQDIVIALFNSAGKRLWAKEFGGAQEEACTAVSVDENGDVYATGVYDGELSFTGSALPNPGSSFRRWIWLAKFDGRTGKPLAQASFGQGPGNHRPHALVVAPSGRTFLAGSLSNSLAFGGPTEPLRSAGAQDAFVARVDLKNDFSPVWAVRLGGPGPDVAHGLAVDASGAVWVTGFVTATPDGTSGVAQLGRNATPSAPLAFLVSLDEATGKTLSAATYGENDVGMTLALSPPRSGQDQILALGAEGGGHLDLGPAGRIEPGGADFLLLLRR